MRHLTFKDINLDDPFFDSLKESYEEFPKWFARKSEEKAYVTFEDNNIFINGFLYLKREDGAMDDVIPIQADKKRLKVGTFKINGRGTKYGDRFVKKILDTAVSQDVDEVYLTIFDRHSSLISLIEKYGFEKRATKTTINGEEDVYFKDMRNVKGNILLDYPLMQTRGRNKYCLSIYPKYHTRLFPDSILNSETYDVIEDVSHTNSIPKIYVCSMFSAKVLAPGDIIVTYRTKDEQGSAHYRSVVTSVCVVEDVRFRLDFNNFEELFSYANEYSVFDREDLSRMWDAGKDLIVIKMTYNIALTKRITKKILMDDLGINPRYWGIFALTDEQFKGILERGETYENIIID
ncbi:N-acetyltransferase [Bacteroides coprosuis]|uniref:N-acetyltransferase n=1 Tax=Bacteroides coprosuis TaxID=151276 RepID=UPI001D996376|nr:N-acetyltransferase [Bacteroides coprosuis]HJD91956.1 N-acetyltransferase [Bacteroides coprosuis]